MNLFLVCVGLCFIAAFIYCYIAHNSLDFVDCLGSLAIGVIGGGMVFLFSIIVLGVNVETHIVETKMYEAIPAGGQYWVNDTEGNKEILYKDECGEIQAIEEKYVNIEVDEELETVMIVEEYGQISNPIISWLLYPLDDGVNYKVLLPRVAH